MPNLTPWIPPLNRLDLSQWSSIDGASPLGNRRLITHDGQVIIAQVTVSEDGDDELEITNHPVQQGAVINDHAFKRPAEVRVQMGWSNAYMSYLGEVDVKQIYEQILIIQASRLPCILFTGKRQYNNMLIQSIRTHTDAKLEYSFLADIAFREVVLVNTSVIAVTGASYNAQALVDQRYAQLLPGGKLNPMPAVADPGNIL